MNNSLQAVLSGDTIVLVGKATDGPPPEITLTLNDIQCPKIARSPNQTDEPYAWQSREFLRKLCIGKPVSFRVTQMVPAINRTFGYAIMNGESLSQVATSRYCDIWNCLHEPLLCNLCKSSFIVTYILLGADGLVGGLGNAQGTPRQCR